MKRTIHFVGYLLQVSVCSHRYVESEYYTSGEEFWAEDDGASYGRTVQRGFGVLIFLEGKIPVFNFWI
jgi:hypothetical protein